MGIIPPWSIKNIGRIALIFEFTDNCTHFFRLFSSAGKKVEPQIYLHKFL